MIVNLIKARQMFSLTLPQKVKGQYWLSDLDEKGKQRHLISIEAEKEEWIIKSNRKVSVLDKDNQPVAKMTLASSGFYNLRIAGSQEKVTIYAEPIDATRQTLRKIMVTRPANFTIGRLPENNFYYDNGYVSGQHAVLSYDGTAWSIADTESRNGTYVNGYRVKAQRLQAGDFIYIMGLKIVIGSDYIAVNNPDQKLQVRAENMTLYRPQTVTVQEEEPELPEKEFFFRSPHFHREIEHTEIRIDPPPPFQKQDTVPVALMLGPSLTMGMTSVVSAIMTFNNTMSNGGDISSALPSLMMSASMLLGTVLWPTLTKRFERKEKIKNEQLRQEKYLAYLNEVGEKIKALEKEQRGLMYERYISQEECASRVKEHRAELWERVIGQKDFLKLRLGLGDVPMDLKVLYQEKRFSMDSDDLQNAMLSLAEEPKQLKNVPICVSLPETMTVGMYGTPEAQESMLKTLILQMVSLHSYDELKIMLLIDEGEKDKWDFVKYLPHFWDDEKSVRFYATDADEAKELSVYLEHTLQSREDKEEPELKDITPYYVIFSASEKVGNKCEALKQLVKYKHNMGFTVFYSAGKQSDLPKETKTVICLDGEQSYLFDRDDPSNTHIYFAAEKVNEQLIRDAAGELANIELDLSNSRYSLPNMITFLEMFNVSKVEHLNSLTRWKENNPTKTLQTPIGVDTQGEPFNLDLHEKFHGPHGLVAGMTGSGKSEFIITYILSLAVNYHPDEVAFVLIDYKGGGLTGAFEDPDRGVKLPHLAGTITNLDGAAVKRSLISIQSELRRRQAIFNEARKISNEGTMDIYKYQQLYRKKVVSEPVPHLMIISDEFAELKTQQPEFMEQLISTARIGRSLGVHLILATQKPSGVVDDQIWSNSKFRVCLKVQDRADSQDMIKCPDAAAISQTGRFYLQVGYNELFALGQSAWCGAEYVPSETVEKSVDSSIQVVDNLGRVMMSAKPNRKRSVFSSDMKQIVAIVKYLSDLANEEKASVRPLWLPPIAPFIYVDELEEKYNVKSGGTVLNPVVGEYDDPFNQRQNVLTIPFSEEGNCLVYGATGNGKTTFLTTLCYSLLRNHTAEELNLYIMDFGSETLKVFEKAPQVGGVITSSDEEKVLNFLKMIQAEISRRKALFSEYGGDYASYCRNSGKTIPNIVVAINNYAGFAEQFEDYVDALALFTRDGVKYGIYFVMTASSTNAVRNKTLQNFKLILTMQLNDASDYSSIIGKTEGLVPSKYKGRGLAALDQVYEFQTAYCHEGGDQQDFLRHFCRELVENTHCYAKQIPMLPDVVDYEFVRTQINGLENVPVGVGKKNLDINGINLANKVVYPIVTSDLEETKNFVEELTNVLSKTLHTTVINAAGLLPEDAAARYHVITDGFEELGKSLFGEMVLRNNTYKDANLELSSLDEFEEKVYVICGFKKFYEQLSTGVQEMVRVLLEKGEWFYKIHFVIVETASDLNGYKYDDWYKRQIPGTEGIWIGDGIADQYVLGLTKISSDLYEDIGRDYGYVIQKKRPVLVKLLSAGREEE